MSEIATSQSFTEPSLISTPPIALLWTYEFRRQNGVLTSRLLDVKEQLNQTEQLTELLSKYLNDLIVIIASIAGAVTSHSRSAEQRIRLLHHLLAQALEPLSEYEASMDLNDQAFIDCIAQLKTLYDLPAFLIDENEVYTAHLLSTAPSPTSVGMPEPTASSNNDPGLTDRLLAASTSSFDKDTIQDDPNPPADAAENALAMKLDAVMQQEGRPLEGYFEAACEFRRDQIRMRQANDSVFIEAFLAGCDNKLYRRRLTHALRKNGWYWTWLAHEVQFLILEQEYMDKQNYALEHVLPDGTFLWPDGTCKRRIVTLPPITEEDLTDSESSNAD
ncbi:uncharacterized protein N7482_009867 [Penicillium canariense]|uniref:Uncharacterized protein n=1 Tax=Penicillium canariense TaxID=189055 RepID=A0A9W9HTZ4_9EURO|nr:uncharacterized protein N7482_009867 [Penicillium canariense]KAJ5153389.1 hypothetical protein N7482_009867 [Penicillium canariense]